MTRMMRAAIPLVAALAGLGCDPQYGSLRLQEGAGEVDAAYISESGITIMEGKVVVVFAEPISVSASNDYEGIERFSLRVVDQDVAEVHRGVLRDSFVLVGARMGLTRLEVVVDDRVEDTVPLEIIAQGGGQ